MNTDPQSEKALKSAYFCYLLAFLVMAVTAFFMFQGVEATEPDSPARDAKLAAGVLLLILEGCAFSLAGQWREFSFALRGLGWAIFALQITLMTLAQYSVGATAGKAAALSAATVEEIRAQADADRKAAQTLQQSSDKLNRSKHGWLNAQGGQAATAAAERTAAAGGAIDKLEKLNAVRVSTPLIEILGAKMFFALSLAVAVIFEGAGIVLMHVAGSLRRKAAVGQPVEQQILGMLHQMQGVKPAPLAAALPTPAPAAAVEIKAPLPGWSMAKPSAYAAAAVPLGAVAAPMPYAPPAPTPPSISVPSVLKTRAATVLTQAQSAPATVLTQAQSAPATVLTQAHQQPAVSVLTQAQPAPAKQAKKRSAPRPGTAAVADGAKLDTGTSGNAAARYSRIKSAVAAGTLKPSVRSMQGVEGGGTYINRRYLQQLEKEGVIKREGRGYVLKEA